MLSKLIIVLISLAFMHSTRLLLASSEKINATVHYCYDGDTCRVKVADSLWFNVRLAGIDAPEKKKGRKTKTVQPFGLEATAHINQLIKGQTVQLLQHDLDHYNRPIVEIFLKSKNINLDMVQQGLAQVYTGKVKRLNRAPYVAAEQVAHQKKIGIWSLANYSSPDAFRKANK